MAAIDKIYGTTTEYDEFHAWCKEHKPEALMYFYTRDGYEGHSRPITNFPEEIDRWMLNNCPIEFVTDRIKDQYGDDITQLTE